MFKPHVLAMLVAVGLATSALAEPQRIFVDIPGDPGVLKGTLLAPETGPKGPAIVILPGSGPTDRDGNNPLGVRGGTYRMLAEGLAAQGVTTLRMDKRGLFASATASNNPNGVTVADLAVDANAWAAKLKAETGAPCVWLLGHSEGGLVALLAAMHGEDLCGLILVSTGGRNYADVLLAQIDANPANPPEIRKAAAEAIAALKAGNKVDPATLPPPLGQQLFNPVIQDFLIEAFRHDPAWLVRAVDKPVLIIQGENDIQVPVGDAKLLKAAQPGATLVVLPGVNHILKLGTTDRQETRANYADPSLPLAPGVIDAIAKFVKR